MEHVYSPSNHKIAAPQGRLPDTRLAFRRSSFSPVSAESTSESAHRSAEGSPLPTEKQAELRRRFHFDFSSVRVHTDEAAADATRRLGARAYTTGSDIMFAPGEYVDDVEGQRVLAHELVHVIQQSPPFDGGSLGALDKAEVEARALAGPPVLSAQVVLQRVPAGTIQRLGERLDAPLPATAPKPAYGEDTGQQRRYSVEQFIELWETEQGRKLTDDEKKTLARGCIGITALNVDGSGNPPLDLAYSSFEKAQATADAMNAVIDGVKGHAGGQVPPGTRAIIFAQLFWSNQAAVRAARAAPDPKAFLPDKEGRVAMGTYKYRAQPGYVNFDYGFWDAATQSFWHANHSQPEMEVYQSTREKFEKGYVDFDRIVYCVAVTHNYDPRKAAMSEAMKGAASKP